MGLGREAFSVATFRTSKMIAHVWGVVALGAMFVSCSDIRPTVGVVRSTVKGVVSQAAGERSSIVVIGDETLALAGSCDARAQGLEIRLKDGAAWKDIEDVAQGSSDVDCADKKFRVVIADLAKLVGASDKDYFAFV
jgi:hypothetical protein